ncbi:hypothetical protein [Snodgrassella alvi]|uniref:hypothetical protein n=1 Tax=Snodgrassella alvi TaxID=1196083 RepID=UPI000A01BB28|nr:hypothetical protein [Snodgrassella alvi]ORF02052.1 hypothetical protein BGH97_05585 [Snodgrassella alvi]ORF09287.1 hypothetical protein BGH99_02720 [Snodgrassella alvi]ORF13731.1 hypothetical protein BGI02_06580 [Snodgrassella alvi]ORF14811.1 hypothetical protein BGI00_01620 [Snodgrassella alvi]ORF28302.1 hypothetical protein BGI06_00090 [Snodgrassella alvi]
MKTGVHSALAAQSLPVQQVTLDVADNLTVQVNLVQMAGTIIQFADGTPGRQGGANKLVGSVVLEICDNFNVCQQVQNILLFYFHKIRWAGCPPMQ